MKIYIRLYCKAKLGALMKYLLKNWEIIYTDAKSGKEGYADELSIDHINKRYVLDVDMCDTYIIGDNSDEIILHPCYVSTLKFINTVKNLKESGYKELRPTLPIYFGNF